MAARYWVRKPVQRPARFPLPSLHSSFRARGREALLSARMSRRRLGGKRDFVQPAADPRGGAEYLEFVQRIRAPTPQAPIAAEIRTAGCTRRCCPSRPKPGTAKQ